MHNCGQFLSMASRLTVFQSFGSFRVRAPVTADDDSFSSSSESEYGYRSTGNVRSDNAVSCDSDDERRSAEGPEVLGDCQRVNDEVVDESATVAAVEEDRLAKEDFEHFRPVAQLSVDDDAFDEFMSDEDPKSLYGDGDNVPILDVVTAPRLTVLDAGGDEDSEEEWLGQGNSCVVGESLACEGEIDSAGMASDSVSPKLEQIKDIVVTSQEVNENDKHESVHILTFDGNDCEELEAGHENQSKIHDVADVVPMIDEASRFSMVLEIDELQREEMNADSVHDDRCKLLEEYAEFSAESIDNAAKFSDEQLENEFNMHEEEAAEDLSDVILVADNVALEVDEELCDQLDEDKKYENQSNMEEEANDFFTEDVLITDDMNDGNLSEDTSSADTNQTYEICLVDNMSETHSLNVSAVEKEDTISEDSGVSFDHTTNCNEQIFVNRVTVVESISHKFFLVSEMLKKLGLAKENMGVDDMILKFANNPSLQVEKWGKGDSDSSLTILFLGKTGVGKSATINSLLGENIAPVNPFEPGGRRVEVICRTVNGVKIRMIDTPGFTSSDTRTLKILSQVKKVAWKFPPDIVLYVDRLDYQCDDSALLKMVTDYLSPSIWRIAVITLTHAGVLSDASVDTEVARRRGAIHRFLFRGEEVQPLMPVAVVENSDVTWKYRSGQNWRTQLLLLCFLLRYRCGSVHDLCCFGRKGDVEAVTWQSHVAISLNSTVAIRVRLSQKCRGSICIKTRNSGMHMVLVAVVPLVLSICRTLIGFSKSRKIA